MKIEPITDEQLNEGLNQCDRCGAIHESIDLFWAIDWDEHTPRQAKVFAYMQSGLDAVCEACFYEIAKEVA